MKYARMWATTLMRYVEFVSCRLREPADALEVARILKPGSKWLYITWRQPHFIRPLLQREGIWKLETETLAEQPGGGGMLEYFGFVMTKYEVEDEGKLS
jgi:hypothetical protein